MRAASFIAGLVLAGTGLAFAGSDYYPPEALHVDKGGSLQIGDSCTPSERPALSTSQKLKRQLLSRAGLSRSQARDYELDHIVPLCLGGDPVALSNLQLQRCDEWRGARCVKGDAADKDEAEAFACNKVKSGEMSCREAKELFRAGNWKFGISAKGAR